MAIAKLHSLRGERSALIMLKTNKFEFGSTPIYIPRVAVKDLEPGSEFEIPDGYKIVDLLDVETGKVRTTKTGESLKTLVW
jgi:hypothetical protein